VADHDAHCNTYGQGIPNRTVYLLPSGASLALSKSAWLQAHRARHFYASEDSNVQLVFATSDGRIMGDDYTASGPVTLRAAAYDPAGETLSSLEIWRGQIGGGVPAAAYRSVANQSSASFTEASLPAATTTTFTPCSRTATICGRRRSDHLQRPAATPRLPRW
jgi:hypothetical protein